MKMGSFAFLLVFLPLGGAGNVNAATPEKMPASGEVQSAVKALDQKVKEHRQLEAQVPSYSPDELVLRARKLGEQLAIQMRTLHQLSISPMREEERLKHFERIASEMRGSLGLALVLPGKGKPAGLPAEYSGGKTLLYSGLFSAAFCTYSVIHGGELERIGRDGDAWLVVGLFAGVYTLIGGGIGLVRFIVDDLIWQTPKELKRLSLSYSQWKNRRAALRAFFEPLKALAQEQPGTFLVPFEADSQWLVRSLDRLHQRLECQRLLAGADPVVVDEGPVAVPSPQAVKLR